MNNNCFILLKILIQGKFSMEEILKYLPMNPISLHRNFRILNDFLGEMGVPKIRKEGDFYSLQLSSQERKRLFSKIDIFSFDQRTSYLFIKLMLNSFINLEAERIFLNVSRTTINRDFDYIKDRLKPCGVSLKYIYGKGIALDSGIGNAGFLFCQLVMKLVAEKDFLPLKLNHFITELLSKDIDKFYKERYEIFKNLGLSMGDFTFNFIYAQDVGFTLIPDFNLDLTSQNIAQIENTPLFLEIKSSLNNCSFTNEKHHNYLTCAIYNIKTSSTLLSGEFSILVKNIFKKIKNDFVITIEIPSELERIFSHHLYIGIFKYTINTFDVKILQRGTYDKILLSYIEKLLKEFKIELTYCEISSLATVLKKILIYNIVETKFSILLLISNFNYSQIDGDIEARLKLISPNINYKLEPTLYFEYLGKLEENAFDLIISDSYLTASESQQITRVKNFNTTNLEEEIIKFILKKALLNFKIQ